jgi:SAM-dependent methyltransferase
LKNTKGLTIVDIGSQDVNGSLRSVAPPNNKYIGVDFVEAKGVDVVITDPYSLPFEDESVDAVVSSSCFEHSEFFWLLFNEALRILKPTGLLYINVPSNGQFHRYPVDCWRFYPDSGVALQNWGKRSGYS